MANVGDFTKKGSKKARRISLSIFFFLAIVGLTCFYFLDYRYNHNSAELSLPNLSQKVSSDINVRNYSGAVKLINRQPRNKLNTENEQLLLGSVYINAGNYQKSLTVYRSAISKYGISLPLAQAAAQAALSANDYKDAVYYYNQSANLIKQQNIPLAGTTSQYYSARAKQITQEYNL
ncbi:MAG TPA: hypothetical protein VMR34_01525 [Candidatus Saccharimonadales bacterium]|nr:hypothetical protein [Candidatus Saccharimonadales bacterium]